MCIIINVIVIFVIITLLFLLSLSSLLFSSSIMIILFLFLLFNYHPIFNYINFSPISMSDFDYDHFWEWTDFQSYVEFMLTFSTMGCLLMYVFIDSPLFVETIGFISVLTEALLAAPQFYRNFITKSTFGMR